MLRCTPTRCMQGTIVAIECPSRRLYGLQYHPEVVHSKNGVRTLKQFLFEVARIPADWKMSNVLDEEMAKIAAVVRLECCFTSLLTCPVRVIRQSVTNVVELPGTSTPSRIASTHHRV